MELKDYIVIGLSITSLVIVLVGMLRRGGARDATVDLKLVGFVTREELQKDYVSKGTHEAAIAAAMDRSALRFLGSHEGHEMVTKTAGELHARLSQLNEVLHSAVNATTHAARDKTEQINIQVHVLKEGIAFLTDGLETLESSVSELLTKTADQNARIVAMEQSRVAFEALREKVAQISGILANSGKKL